MPNEPTTQVAQLIRELRESAGLTQKALAERVGTTQSVISRLESDDYEGHSLSMLYRIGAALNRRIAVTAVDAGGNASARLTRGDALAVAEAGPIYGTAGASGAWETGGLSASELDRLMDRVAERFGDRGITRADIEEAVRWAQGSGAEVTMDRLRGAIAVGAGDVQADIREARATRGASQNP